MRDKDAWVGAAPMGEEPSTGVDESGELNGLLVSSVLWLCPTRQA